MKNKGLLLLLCIAMTINVMAQKDKSKGVTTKYLSLPAYDMSKNDPAVIAAEFSMGEVSFGTEKLKDTKTGCVPKGGGLKDAVEVTTYYYELPVTFSESYLVAKDPSGNIVYASEISNSIESVSNFGYQKCEYWVLDNMKKDWKAKSGKFKSEVSKKYESEKYKNALDIAKANVYLSFTKTELDVYSAKGKGFDYTELDAAFEKALNSYKNISKVGPNQADFKLLTECISVWEKELETADLEDKKARISKSIAKGLHENCTRAYMFMYNADKAKEHARSFLKLFGNHHSNRTDNFDLLLKTIELQKIAIDKNKALIGNISDLNAKANEASKKSVKVANLSSSDFSRLKSDYFAFQVNQHSDVIDERKKDEADAIADGTLNPFQKFVTSDVRGPILMMTMGPSPLTGFPELKALPVEICKLEGLTQLIIMSNKIESIPPEIADLTELSKLDLTNNKLTSVPKEIGQLSNLKTLKLGKNPIESLPKEIANCKNLKSLVLKDCKLSDAAKQDLASWLPDCKIKY